MRLFLGTSIEFIQNHAAPFIVCNYPHTSSVSSIKIHLHLPDLSARRKIARLCPFPVPSFVSPTVITNSKLKCYLSCRTNFRFNSFVAKTASQWNHLPASIASTPDSSSFKRAISNTVQLLLPTPLCNSLAALRVL